MIVLEIVLVMFGRVLVWVWDSVGNALGYVWYGFGRGWECFGICLEVNLHSMDSAKYESPFYNQEIFKKNKLNKKSLLI